jgi:hypothetical protein
VIQLTVGEQAAVGGDPGTVEFELDPAIESGSQREFFGFTRRVLHDRAPSLVANSNWISKIGRSRHQNISSHGKSGLNTVEIICASTARSRREAVFGIAHLDALTQRLVAATIRSPQADYKRSRGASRGRLGGRQGDGSEAPRLPPGRGAKWASGSRFPAWDDAEQRRPGDVSSAGGQRREQGAARSGLASRANEG